MVVNLECCSTASVAYRWQELFKKLHILDPVAFSLPTEKNSFKQHPIPATLEGSSVRAAQMLEIFNLQPKPGFDGSQLASDKVTKRTKELNFDIAEYKNSVSKYHSCYHERACPKNLNRILMH
jgi:hypothetical protein